jgi:hypothetical protein
MVRTMVNPLAAAAVALAPLALPFPATTPKAVVALATQPAAVGKAHYLVRSPGASYTIDVAGQGRHVWLKVVVEQGTLWLGTQGSKVVFTCASTRGVAPRCFRGDPQHIAAGAVAAAQVIDNGFIRRTFGPAAALPQSKVAQRHQAGQAVSCFSLTAGGNTLQLCSNRTGIVTELTAGKTRVLATRVSTEVTAHDLAPPAALR